MGRLTERTTDGSGGYKIQAKNLDSHCVVKNKRGYVTYYGQHIDKLAEYEDLEEQGLLLRLPCKVGDTIYFKAYRGTIVNTRVTVVNTRVTDILIDSEKIIVCDEVKNHFDINDFGKTVFLTKEEAEQKLKEMESD